MTRSEAFARIAGVIQDILSELDSAIAAPTKGDPVGEAHAHNELAIALEALLIQVERAAVGGRKLEES